MTKPTPTSEEAFQTEQFKSPPDPVDPPADPENVTLIDIPADEPYPTGGATPEPAPKPKHRPKEES